jgi:hypothetical protein
MQVRFWLFNRKERVITIPVVNELAKLQLLERQVDEVRHAKAGVGDPSILAVQQESHRPKQPLHIRRSNPEPEVGCVSLTGQILEGRLKPLPKFGYGFDVRERSGCAINAFLQGGLLIVGDSRPGSFEKRPEG